MALLPALKHHRIQYERIHNSPEILLNCPACVGKGQHQEFGRLYFNTVKNVGVCQRCGWAGKEQKLLTLLNIRFTGSLDAEEEPAKPQQQPRRVAPFPLEAILATKNKEAMAYLRSRLLTDEEIERYAFFYCAEGFYARRIIIPVCDRHGQYRAFLARSIDKDAEKKYLNPPGTSMSRLLYNLHHIRQRSSCWIVEGTFDSIHCFPYAVATFGKHISDAQVRLLQIHGITQVFLIFDAECHQKTPDLWTKAVQKLRASFFTIEVKLPSETPTEYPLAALHTLCREAM